MVKFRLSNHDGHPNQDTSAVDLGLGQFNDRAAPLHEVRLLSCFAHSDSGQLLGGAVGRWWGSSCELQQLWVDEPHRGQGLGAALITEFEISAQRNGCCAGYCDGSRPNAPKVRGMKKARSPVPPATCAGRYRCSGCLSRSRSTL